MSGVLDTKLKILAPLLFDKVLFVRPTSNEAEQFPRPLFIVRRVNDRCAIEMATGASEQDVVLFRATKLV